MQFYKSLIHFGIVGTSIVLASLPVQAAVITYTDRAAFLAALSSSSTDNYNDLNGFYNSPLSRTIPAYIYDAAATGGLYIGAAGGSQVLSSNNPVPLVLNFANGAPTAVGGYFFNTDISFNIINGAIAVTANPGASVQSVVTSSATSTSLVIVPATGGSTAYPAVDDLVLGQAVPASVPGPLPLMGAATAFGFSRRLRSRIAAARPRA